LHKEIQHKFQLKVEYAPSFNDSSIFRMQKLLVAQSFSIGPEELNEKRA
jgi:hypothetical protein